VLCDVDAERAVARRAARALADPSRASFHPEAVVELDRPTADYDPPRLDVPTLRVDTSDGYEPALETIVAFARA
jgi:hypothetical protein